MRYRSDIMNKMQSGVSPQYMPDTCGAYNGGMPAAMNHGACQPPLHNGSLMGVHHALPAMPTGFPTGGTVSPLLPTAAGLPSTIAIPGMPAGMQVPVTVESTLYTPGFLRTQIGKRMKVEFLVGTSSMTDRIGTLVAVGASYIIIKLFESDDLMMCDIYSIKFVTIYL